MKASYSTGIQEEDFACAVLIARTAAQRKRVEKVYLLQLSLSLRQPTFPAQSRHLRRTKLPIVQSIETEVPNRASSPCGLNLNRFSSLTIFE